MAGCTSVFNARLASFLPSYWCVALLDSFGSIIDVYVRLEA